MITNESYFDRENQMEYFGTSQIKEFLECESRAMASINGEYIREKTTALLVGSYVDAHFSKELDLFRAQNPEIFTLKGTLKSEFKKAEDIIARIERDSLMMQFLSGEQQVIKTAEMFGHKFKIKIDSYHPSKLIADLKIMRDMEPVWKDGRKQHFIEAWNYRLQAAIYQAVEGNRLPFYLVVATKEGEPDIAVIQIDQPVMDFEMAELELYINRFADIKKGLINPGKCGKCDWCKSQKNAEIELYTGEE
jgi:hypothetical protein